MIISEYVYKWKELLDQEKAFLNTLDLLCSIDKDSSVDNNMDRIELIYGEKYQNYIRENNLIPSECIFNSMGEDEFIDYFTKKYNCRYSEQVIHFFEIEDGES